MSLGNVPVARGLNISGNERELTFVELDSFVSQEFHDNNILFSPEFTTMQPLAPGASSFEFPIFGDSPEDAEHHIPGQAIVGGTVTNGTKVVTLDDILYKALELPIEDVTLAKWDLVRPYAEECARIVAEKLDNRLFVLLTAAARQSALANVYDASNYVGRTGTAITGAYPVTAAGATNFLDDLSTMARQWDERNIPTDGRYCFISPYIAQVLTRGERVINSDYRGSGGNVSTRELGIVEGFKLMATNHLPNTGANVSGDLSKYNLTGLTYATEHDDGGVPAALCMYSGNRKGPLAAVTANGIQNKVWWDERYLTWQIKTQVHIGMDWINPWTAGEIRVGAEPT